MLLFAYPNRDVSATALGGGVRPVLKVATFPDAASVSLSPFQHGRRYCIAFCQQLLALSFDVFSFCFVDSFGGLRDIASFSLCRTLSSITRPRSLAASAFEILSTR